MKWRGQSIVRVMRLSHYSAEETIKALQGLYHIDTKAFKKEDQYGTKLLILALRQPSAFWVAKFGNEYVGYLSIFQMRSNRLCRDLQKQAESGQLDIPDLGGRYLNEVTDTGSLDEPTPRRSNHLYVDAIAVVKDGHRLPPSHFGEIGQKLIDDAKKDTAASLPGVSTICTIATRKGIRSVIERSEVPLKHVGGRKKTVTDDDLYREFFILRRGRNMLDRLIDALARFQFGPYVGFDPVKGIPVAGVDIRVGRQ